MFSVFIDLVKFAYQKVFCMPSLLNVSPSMEKNEVFESVESFLINEGFSIQTRDKNRPWGGFFVLEERDIRKFKDFFFKEAPLTEAQLEQKMSPKFLIVAPKARLSWQYHFRRSELWTLIAGESALSRSLTDEQQPHKSMQIGDLVSLEKGERHRLIGGEGSWGIVAEIWVHSDPDHPSDESDIVRLQDDYSRT